MANDLKFSLVLTADASAAKRETSEVTKALDGLKDQAAQTSGAQTGLGTASREAAAGITAAAGANTGVAQAAKEAASRLDTQKNATAGASAALSTMAQAGGDASARVGMLVPVSQGLGKAAKTASDGLDQQAKSTNIAKDALDRMHKSAQTGIAGLGRLARMAGITGAALAASFSARALAATADGWSDMSSRIGAAVKDMDAAQGLMTDMLRLANASYSAIGQTVDTFASNIGPMRDLGYSTKEVLDYTESLNHMLVITATKGEQAASVQNALSKAMATGKMDAQGLETVLANGGRVAEALAKELGTTTSGLRKMASEGKLTGQVIARALLKSLEDVREEAAQMPSTIGDGLLRIGNGVTALIGSIDQALGASAAVADWLNGIAEGIGKIAAKDFSGLMDSMKNAAIGLGQALMVLAATRIPALIAGIAAINIQTALMTGRFIAGAAASRGMAAAIAAKTLAVRGLASALALAG
ncbi:MAG: tape measure protein, partial [Paracoccus sp. (in: a-proteobacteria)]|uniref:tape measure protein n=1 Tax=Paracoccus sp. TaxID=267 RepID=UPI0026E056EB